MTDKQDTTEEKVEPIEVKIINHPEPKKEELPSEDEEPYQGLAITEEQIKEFEKENAQ